jgi:prevent-host-death family protein
VKEFSMKEVINIQEAKTHLSRYVDKVAAGEELVIGKAGKPLAKLVPYKAPRQPRKLGLLAGELSESPDAWSKETDLELASEMYGKELSGDAAEGFLVAEDKDSFSQ